jgi:hypothetical protein
VKREAGQPRGDGGQFREDRAKFRRLDPRGNWLPPAGRCTRTKVERATQTVGPLKKNLWMHHDGRRTKELSSKLLLYLRKKRVTTISVGDWNSG